MKTNKMYFLVLGVLALLAFLPSVRAFAASLNLSKGTTFSVNLAVLGSVSKGSGTFVIDDPLDPANKLLFHSFVESPDAKNIYDGTATLDAKGEAVIELPAYFEALNKNYRYEFFPIGAAAPNLYIKQQVQNNSFVIAGGPPGIQVSWQVTGIRHDPYILAHPIVPEVVKGPGQLIGQGQYLFPEGYASSSQQ